MGEAEPEHPAPRLERVWDGPTRALKWSLAAAVTASWAYGAGMRFDTIGAHMALGYLVAGLLAARLLWGLIGPKPSALLTMARDGARAARYARGVLKPEPSYWPGHNPMGALWVLALFASLSLQIATGLMNRSERFSDAGPLAEIVGPEWSALAHAAHGANAYVLLALIGLHLLAVFFYAAWKMEDLISPMISGWKLVKRRDDEGA